MCRLGFLIYDFVLAGSARPNSERDACARSDMGYSPDSIGARPPFKDVILSSLAEPPATILALRRSLRKRACSCALDSGLLLLAVGGVGLEGASMTSRQCQVGIRDECPLMCINYEP